MKKNKVNLVAHFRKLWFYNFNRLKDNNYQSMREYFAGILIDEIEEFMGLQGKRVLDVGGARGEFCKVMHAVRGTSAFNLDPDPFEYGAYKSSFLWPKTTLGYASAMPFKSDEFDLVMCRGVLEHIPSNHQLESLREMFRVTKKGGICYVAVPPWFNPFAGHGLKPFHYLPFKYAKKLAEAAYKKKINASSWEEKRLFPITFRKMCLMIRKSGFKLIATKDTHFRFHFLTKVPGIREVFIPMVAFILRKP